MWKAIISLLTRAIVLAEDLQRLREQVKEHSRLLDELAGEQTNLRYEYQLQRERDARERERGVTNLSGISMNAGMPQTVAKRNYCSLRFNRCKAN